MLFTDKRLSGVEVNQEQQFMVDTKGAGGQGQLEVEVVSIYLFGVSTVLSEGSATGFVFST